MELLSRGRVLPQGIFSLHSRFQKVINFKTEEGTLLSLVTEEVGAGPFRLVVKELSKVQEREELQLRIFESGAIKVLAGDLEELVCHLETNTLFDASYPYVHLENIRSRQEFLRELLVKKAPLKSLIFLLDESREAEFKTSFELAYKKTMKEAYNPLGKTKLSDVIVAFKGKGVGLTPSGDDFNLGFLTALSLQDLASDELFENAKGENLFVNSFLYELKMKWASEKLQNFLKSFEDSSTEFISAVESFLSQGETSGADFLVGFYTGFNLGRVYAN